MSSDCIRFGPGYIELRHLYLFEVHQYGSTLQLLLGFVHAQERHIFTQVAEPACLVAPDNNSLVHAEHERVIEAGFTDAELALCSGIPRLDPRSQPTHYASLENDEFSCLSQHLGSTQSVLHEETCMALGYYDPAFCFHHGI